MDLVHHAHLVGLVHHVDLLPSPTNVLAGLYHMPARLNHRILVELHRVLGPRRVPGLHRV